MAGKHQKGTIAISSQKDTVLMIDKDISNIDDVHVYLADIYQKRAAVKMRYQTVTVLLTDIIQKQCDWQR